MKTFKDLKDEITRIKSIDVKGFDSDWVLRKFARDQALINIELIRPYTDRYNTIVGFLVTGKNADVATYATYTATAAATYAAAAVAATSAIAAASAATYATYATYAATHATHAVVADADYTKSIEGLNTLANEYLALLACAK